MNQAKIVGIGACVMDTLIAVPHYPTEDTKLRAISSKPAGGGPVATGLVAAQKLGVPAEFIGVLSDDAGGKFLISDFEAYGMKTDHITVQSGYRSFTSCIWLSQSSTSRTCVFDKGNLPPLRLTDAQKQAIADAELLMVDGNELEAAIEGAAWAHVHGKKVLYDAGGRYEGVERLLPLADYLIPSAEFAKGFTGCTDEESAAKALYDQFRPEAVVVTCGKRGGVLYNGSVVWYPIYPATVVDSNGAGDVFHGAFAAGIVMGFDPEKCCHFSSAVSGLKCTGVGARESVPDFETVKQYMKENGYEL